MNNRFQPESYPRRVLMLVTGLSPQIVTETLFALTQSSTSPFLPTEIRLITTEEGARRARLSLFSSGYDWFSRLLHDFSLPPIAFDPQDIVVLKDRNGMALSDIRTQADNQRAADLITEQVRDVSSDPDAALHVSIAGGRKTMGFYLGYALSLFGRPQDRLSHVLVSAPYESCLDFFYPTPYERVIEIRGHGPVDCAEAEVTLADIPFVSLRDGLPEQLLTGAFTFGDTVSAARKALEPAELLIDLKGRHISAAGELFALPPSELAFLAWFARRRIQGLPGLAYPAEDFPERGYAEEYLCEYGQILGEMGDDEVTQKALAHGIDKRFFEQKKSKLGRSMKNALGPAADAYLVKPTGKKPALYQLGISAESIRFIDLPRPDRSA